MLQRVLLICLITTLAACGPARIEKPNNDLPTLIEIVRLDIGNQQFDIRLSHRQAKPRDPSELACRIKINDNKFVSLETIQTPELTAYARERLNWPTPETLIIPDLARIDYILDCSLQSDEWRKEQFLNRGTLYRIGNQQPGIYR